MRYTHAIVVRIPRSVKAERKIKVDLALAEKQQEELCETLREVCVYIILNIIGALAFAKLVVLIYKFNTNLCCFTEYFYCRLSFNKILFM